MARQQTPSGAPDAVVHLTTVHDPRDPRIAAKECATLAAAGYDVRLIAAATTVEPPVAGIGFRPLPPPRGRLDRLLRTQWHALRALRASGARRLHIHDPELLPLALLLRARGWDVIYDIHEDYRAALRAKPYLPRLVRGPLAGGMALLEGLAHRTCRTVVAERYYRERFPRAWPVLNYPDPPAEAEAACGPHAEAAEGPPRVLYTGNVTAERGARNHAALIHHLPVGEVWLVGYCAPELARDLWTQLGDRAHRLRIPVVGRYVPPAEMADIVAARRWLAGLAVFPADPFHERKELTKFFEYMGRGLPVVASHFPVWQRLIEEAGAGVTVPPDDPAALAAAVAHLRANPAEAAALGRNGRAAVAERYTWSSQGDNLLACYRGEPAP